MKELIWNEIGRLLKIDREQSLYVTNSMGKN